MRLDMTSSSFLLVESRFPRRPPALCFRAPFRFPFFCWCSSALIESSSSSKYSFETTRQMTKTKRRSGGQFCWVFCKRFETKQNKKEESTIIWTNWLTCAGLFFSFFFLPFFSVFFCEKRRPLPIVRREIHCRKKREKKREAIRDTHCVRATRQRRDAHAREHGVKLHT